MSSSSKIFTIPHELGSEFPKIFEWNLCQGNTKAILKSKEM